MDAEDLVYYQDSSGAIMSGGYSIESILLKKGMLPAFTSGFELTTPATSGGTSTQGSSNKKTKEKSPFSPAASSTSLTILAIPAGLCYTSSPMTSSTSSQFKPKISAAEEYSAHQSLDDDMYDRLFQLASFPTASKTNKPEKTAKSRRRKLKVEKISKRQTKKQRNKTD